MTHLLNTNTYINMLQQKPKFILHLNQLTPTDYTVSMITVYELFCGVEKSKDPAKERQKVERFVTTIIELPFDRAAAEGAARIRADLKRKDQPIGPYDLLLTKQTYTNNLTFVTNNVQEFQRINTLRLESWP